MCLGLLSLANDEMVWCLCAKTCDWQPLTGAATVLNKQLTSRVAVLPWRRENTHCLVLHQWDAIPCCSLGQVAVGHT